MRRAYAAMGWIARVGIGLVLIYSGMVKVAQPYHFLSGVFEYELLGPAGATFVAGVLPFIELTIGVALLCGLFTLGAASIAASLFFIFTIGQASALLRGLDADCGCFGAGEKVGWASLLRTMFLLGGAILCVASDLRASRTTARRPTPSTGAPVPLPA